MQPQSFFAQYGEILIANSVQIHAGKVVTHVRHPLPDTLVVFHRPAIYKPTSTV
jgi:hypothetical protein